MLSFKSNAADQPLNKFDLAQLDSALAQTAKPVAIFLHTDWCKYCKVMQNSTLKSEKVQQLLSSNFYFVDFDAEQKQSVNFRGQTFNYLPNGRNNGVHEFAQAVGTSDDGTLAYPTFVLLDADMNIIFQYNAFMDEAGMIAVLEVAIE